MQKTIKYVRLMLLPLAGLYALVLWIRHGLYGFGWKKSKKYALPIICVGNVSFGGTGKTPMTEYLIRFLQKKYRVAVLSRGYLRKTRGFLRAAPQSTAQDLGDEPFQYHQKFPNITVAVDEKRVRGVDNLLKMNEKPEVILLDDAFQHRAISAGLNIVLTAYDRPFWKDFLFPAGDLRDLPNRVQNADCLVVTKCPEVLSALQMQQIRQRCQGVKNLFFTKIKYADFVASRGGSMPLSDWISAPFTLVTGIAMPRPLLDFLTKQGASFEHLHFADHHHFTPKEIQNLQQKKRILTTEKDYARLPELLENVYYLPIEVGFFSEQEQNQFHKMITDFLQ